MRYVGKLKKNDLTDLLLGHKKIPLNKPFGDIKNALYNSLEVSRKIKAAILLLGTLRLCEGTIAQNSAFSTKAHLIHNGFGWYFP